MTAAHSLFERVPGFERNILASRHIDHLAGILACYRSHPARSSLFNGECTETGQCHTIVLRKRLLDAVEYRSDGIRGSGLADAHSVCNDLA